MANAHTPRILVMITGGTVPEVERRYGGFAPIFVSNLTEGFPEGEGPHIDCIDITDRAPGDRSLPLERYAGVVITGSPARIEDQTPWMIYGIDEVRRIIDSRTPLLAVCFGHQMLGCAMGADVGANPAGYTVGSVEIELQGERGDDPLFGPLPSRLVANASHLDAIRAAGPHLTVVGKASHDACHMVKAGPLAWGVQFHPEFTADIVGAYIRARVSLIEEHHGPGSAVRALEGVVETPEAHGLFHSFALVCMSGQNEAAGGER